MSDNESNRRVLIIGNEASAARAGILPDVELEVDIVGSLVEAAEKQASGSYARVIVDQVVFSGSAFEVLASPVSPRRASDDPRTDYSSLRRPSHFTSQIDSVADIIESIRDNFFCLDREWRFTHVNSEAERQFRKSRKELIGYNVWELFPEAVDTPYWDHYHKSMNERIPTSFEAYYPPHDIWTEVRVYPTDDGIAVYCLDISDRKRTEKALRESEERLQLLGDNLPDSAVYQYAYEPDGTPYFIYISGGIERLNGVRVDDVLRDHKTLHSQILPEYYSALMEAEQVSAQNLTDFDMDVQMRRPDGEVRWMRLHSRPRRLQDGRVVWDGVQIDVTDYKRAEQALAQARTEAERRAAEMESFFSSMTDGVVLHDANGNAVLVNESARKVLEAPVTSLGERAGQYRVCKLDGTPMTTEETATGRALRGETIKDLRYKLTAPWSKDKVISVSSSPVRANDESVLGAATVFRDVTDLVKYEQRKEELYEREHHIAEVLQNAIVPSEIPGNYAGYKIAVRYRSALLEAQIGGDFYDVFEIGDGKIGILIGDVAGKGLATAIRVAAARYAIRSYAYLDPRPARVMTMANDALCKDKSADANMLTVFFAVLDTEADSLAYTSAGHEPPIVSCADGTCEELEPGGMAVGLMGGITYHQATRKMISGDMVVMVTDGITEARAAGPILFGKDKLIEFVRSNRNSSPDEIASGILDAATSHAGGQLQDDAAIVVFSAMPVGKESV